METLIKNLKILKKFITDNKELAAVFQGDSILKTVTIDSLAFLHMVTELEKEFQIRFDAETMELIFENFNTVSAYIKNSIQDRA